MSVTRRVDDPYADRTAAVRELRELVGDQLHDLVVEREALAGQDELVAAVRHVGGVTARVVQARGRQRQAREMGLPVAQSVREEGEALSALRQAVMSLAGVCAAWVVKMDYEGRRGGEDA